MKDFQFTESLNVNLEHEESLTLSCVIQWALLYKICPICIWQHKQLAVSIPRLSAPSWHLQGKIPQQYGIILIYETAKFTVKMADCYENLRCQLSHREECSNSVYFDQEMAGWCWECRDTDHELSMLTRYLSSLFKTYSELVDFDWFNKTFRFKLIVLLR